MAVSLTWTDPKVSANSGRALKAATEVIRKDSIERTPKDTGNLQTNCYAENTDTEATVYYTDVYAARQHEEVTWNHPEKGEAKFLEKALRSQREAALQAMADVIGGAW